MKLTVLGSGSRGNAFLLHAAGCSLLIDAGFGAQTILRRARRAGAPLASLAGIVLTHEHGDHARGAPRLARRLGCPIYASRGTLTALRKQLAEVPKQPLDAHRVATIGPFRVASSVTSHDAFEPIAVAVSGPGGKAKIGLAYDMGRITRGVRYLMRGATCLVIEANHDELLLNDSQYPPVVRDRIGGVRGHLSNRAAGELLADLCHPNLECVVLVHLSETCNEPGLARAEIGTHLHRAKYRGALLVADQDEPLDTVHVTGDPDQLEFEM